MLAYTSLLFATIVIHAFYAQHTIYHHTFLAVTICSILRYTTDIEFVRNIDTLVAHFAFLTVCIDWEAPKLRPWIVVFPLCVFILWIAERFWPEDADVLHALLHVTSVIGVHCYVY
jgi:hypothetical protein